MVEESMKRREGDLEDSDGEADMNESYTAFTCLGSGSIVMIVFYRSKFNLLVNALPSLQIKNND